MNLDPSNDTLKLHFNERGSHCSVKHMIESQLGGDEPSLVLCLQLFYSEIPV